MHWQDRGVPSCLLSPPSPTARPAEVPPCPPNIHTPSPSPWQPTVAARLVAPPPTNFLTHTSLRTLSSTPAQPLTTHRGSQALSTRSLSATHSGVLGSGGGDPGGWASAISSPSQAGDTPNSGWAAPMPWQRTTP